MSQDAVAALEAPKGEARGEQGRWTYPLSLAGIALVLVATFILTARQNINWDEFNYLTQVHAFLRGELANRFQTLHVHLFAMLTWLDGDEVDQIVAGRVFMALCLVGSALLIYAIARRFAGRDAALVGLLAYLSLTVVAQHGASFRADPLATLLSLLAIWLLLALPNRIVGAALAGLAMGFALLVTVKTVFYLAAIGAAMLCFATDFRNLVRLAFAFGVPFALAVAALYKLQDASLVPSIAGDPTTMTGSTLDAVWRYLSGIAGKMLFKDGPFPRWLEFVILVALNPLFWFMAIDGAATAIGKARRGTRRDWLPLALALPLLTPIFYRNAYFYFFVFILPPASILIAVSYEKQRARLLARTGRAPRRLAAALVVALLVFIAINYGRLLPDRIAPQRETIAGVHQVFPEPVRYIDGFGTIASFPNVGFFMSSWGMDSYRTRGEPVFPALVEAAEPPLLLADSPSLYAALVPGFEIPEERRLLPEDAQFLSDHYLQYWGMLFVAGTRFAVPAGGAHNGFTIAVTGDYRLEGTGPVRIDGREVMPGETVSLSAGTHRFDTNGVATATEIRLIWAAAEPAPDRPPVDLLKFFAMGRQSE